MTHSYYTVKRDILNMILSRIVIQSLHRRGMKLVEKIRVDLGLCCKEMDSHWDTM